MVTLENETLLTLEEVAQMIRVSVETMKRHYPARCPDFPKPIYITPRTKRWVKSEIEGFIESRMNKR